MLACTSSANLGLARAGAGGISNGAGGRLFAAVPASARTAPTGTLAARSPSDAHAMNRPSCVQPRQAARKPLRVGVRIRQHRKQRPPTVLAENGASARNLRETCSEPRPRHKRFTLLTGQVANIYYAALLEGPDHGHFSRQTCRAANQISADEAIEEGDTDTLREDIMEAFTEEQVEEIERRIDSGDFYDFLSEMLDEWSGEDVDELFELLESALVDVGIDLKYARTTMAAKRKKKKKRPRRTTTKTKTTTRKRTTRRPGLGRRDPLSSSRARSAAR